LVYQCTRWNVWQRNFGIVMLNKYQEVGGILAAARKEKNKTVAAASESTRIMVRYLEAVEAGQPEKLPAPEYFMLFARSYAEFLGIDTAVFEEIEERVRAEAAAAADVRVRPPEIENRAPEKKPKSRKLGRVVFGIVSLIIIAAAVYLAYTLLWPRLRQSSFFSKRAGAVSDEIRPANNAAEMDISVPDQPYQPPDRLRLRLTAIQDVWVTVARDGDTVFNQKLTAGLEQNWEADFRFWVTLSNAQTVDLYINDRKLLPLADKAQPVTDLEINQTNFERYLAPVSDSTLLSAPATQSTSAIITGDTTAGTRALPGEGQANSPGGATDGEANDED
jgi:cytoskeleton protein RodZ